MDQKMKVWIKGSFEAAAFDLQNLVKNMESANFKFSGDYRQFEYLRLILVDHIDAIAKELAIALTDRNWSEIPSCLCDMSKIFDIYKDALAAVVKKQRQRD